MWRLFFVFSYGEMNAENAKKTKRLNKDEIKKQLLESITINNVVEIKHSNELVEKV